MPPSAMRLLLLLSAILSALTGVTGTRAATAQPVAASAPAAGQVARAKGSAVVTARVLAPTPRLGDAALAGLAPTAFALSSAQPLYADRLRE